MEANDAWDAQKEIREVMVFLQGHGVSTAYATKIYKEYGRECIKVVQENPYRLAQDIFGIGFVTADKIAGNLGIARDSEVRAEAGILYVLYQLLGSLVAGPLFIQLQRPLEFDFDFWHSILTFPSSIAPGGARDRMCSNGLDTAG